MGHQVATNFDAILDVQIRIREYGCELNDLIESFR